MAERERPRQTKVYEDIVDDITPDPPRTQVHARNFIGKRYYPGGDLSFVDVSGADRNGRSAVHAAFDSFAAVARKPIFSCATAPLAGGRARNYPKKPPSLISDLRASKYLLRHARSQ